MIVKILNTTHEMSKSRYELILQEASKQVAFGIYAIEKTDFAEIKHDICSSRTKLKQLIRYYKRQGYKVRYNG